MAIVSVTRRDHTEPERDEFAGTVPVQVAWRSTCHEASRRSLCRPRARPAVEAGQAVGHPSVGPARRRWRERRRDRADGEVLEDDSSVNSTPPNGALKIELIPAALPQPMRTGCTFAPVGTVARRPTRYRADLHMGPSAPADARADRHCGCEDLLDGGRGALEAAGTATDSMTSMTPWPSRVLKSYARPRRRRARRRRGSGRAGPCRGRSRSGPRRV